MLCDYLFCNCNLLFSNALDDCLKNVMVVEDFSRGVGVLHYSANLMVKGRKSVGFFFVWTLVVCEAHLGQG